MTRALPAAFARFVVVGAIATAVHAGVFTLAVETTTIDPVAATVLAFCVAMLAGFALNRRYTFSSQGAPMRQLARYAMAQLVGLALNALLMHFAVHVQGWSPYVGLALGIFLVPPVTFALNRWWVFAPLRGS